MLVFSVTSRDSFDELPAFFEQLERLRDVAIREIPIVLLGNKADYDEIDWEVSKREAEAFAARMGCQFFLTSAMTQMNVNESFSAVVKRVLDNRKKEVQPETKKQMAKKCNIL